MIYQWINFQWSCIVHIVCDVMRWNWMHFANTHIKQCVHLYKNVCISLFLPVLCVWAPDAFSSELHNIHTHKPHTKAPNRRTLQYKITLISNSGSDCLFSLLNLFLSKTIAKYDGTIYRWHQFFYSSKKNFFFRLHIITLLRSFMFFFCFLIFFLSNCCIQYNLIWFFSYFL